MSRTKPTSRTATPVAAKPIPRDRVTLVTFAGNDAPKRITAAQIALEAAYLKARKRKLDPAILYLSAGTREQAEMSLTAHYLPEQRDDVSFLQREAESLQRAA